MSRSILRPLAAVALALVFAAGTVLVTVAQNREPVGHSATAHGTTARGEFRDTMRRLWEDHITWTRLVIVSLGTLPDPLPDTDATVARLLRNQDDIGDAVKPFYGDEAGEELSRLLREHIVGAADLLAAAKAEEDTTEEADAWYRNGDEIATFLADANPHNWPADDMKAMMRDHLGLTLDEALARLEGDYEEEVRIYDEIHTQILHMADMLSDGLIRQFPSQFAR